MAPYPAYFEALYYLLKSRAFFGELNIVKFKEIKKIIKRSEITPINNLVLSTASGQSDRDMVLGKIKLTFLVHNGDGKMFPITEEFQFFL